MVWKIFLFSGKNAHHPNHTYLIGKPLSKQISFSNILLRVGRVGAELDLPLRTLFGLGSIDELMIIGFTEMSCDSLKCMTYNANLDFALSLFDTYPSINEITIYSNDENLLHYGRNTDRIDSLIREKKLLLHHVSENQRIIHAKAYSFYKAEECKLVAIGSSNFTRASNRNIELMVIHEPPLSEDLLNLWENVKSLSEELALPAAEPPPFIYQYDTQTIFEIDPVLLEGLWDHQKVILQWLARKQRSIVNIPPGTGKTLIGLRYIHMLASNKKDLTTIILVPTLTLLNQWLEILEDAGFEAIEGSTNPESFRRFLSAPEDNILVTLYSRFWDVKDQISKGLGLIQPPCLLLADECHRMYRRLDDLFDFTKQLETNDVEYFHLGLSATIDTFNPDLMDSYIEYCGGKSTHFDISLPSFYSKWNYRNPNRPILKEFTYVSYFCRLSESEMEEYKRLTRQVGMQSRQVDVNGENPATAALRRANHVRSTESGKRILLTLLGESVKDINAKTSLIFVQTNDIAENVRNFLTNHADWASSASAYVYDSKRDPDYRAYAMKQFTNKHGFCLISERMLAEGFDLPSVSLVLLHGSYVSERDWIQKIGRAIRYDPKTPDEQAKIIDIVFCDSSGSVLPMEEERWSILSSISSTEVL